MRNLLLILATFCLVSFWGCSESPTIDDDPTEQTPGGNSGDNDKDEDGDDDENTTPDVKFEADTDTEPTIEADGGEIEVTFTATAEWTAEVTFDTTEPTRSEAWCTVYPERGEAGTATITITAEPNESTEERSATIVILCGEASVSLTITQSGAEEKEEDDPNEESSKIPENMELAFPDQIFRAYVLENFDTDGDGTISEQEALAVTEINVYNFYNRNDESKCIKSLEGIQYFTNLTYLDCGYNQLTSLDVSGCTELTYLSCLSNQLTSLDVSNNTALESLRCYDNQLTALDVSKNTELTELWCNDNQLTALDVGKNTALTYLSCGWNQLATLDVSGCTGLAYLYCSYNQLTSLDVSKNTELTDLDCHHNQLTALDVSKNTALESLWCYDNQIKELDLSKTNLVNSSYNKDSSYYYPLYCAPMETLKKVYLKKGWSIKGFTEDWGRSIVYIPAHTEIVFVD